MIRATAPDISDAVALLSFGEQQMIFYCDIIEKKGERYMLSTFEYSEFEKQ